MSKERLNSRIRLENQLSSKTDNQKEYIRSIVENQIVLCHGPAGTGKTFIAAGMACQALRNGDISEIILTRPMVQCGKGLGYLKGDLNEKFMPYLLPLKSQIEFFLGKEQVKSLLFSEIIRLMPLELARGENFDNCYAILDEAQNADYEQLKMFMTRLGKNAKIIINGDTKQSDLHNTDLAEVIDRLQDLEDVGIAKLTRADIQRNALIGRVLGRLEDD